MMKNISRYLCFSLLLICAHTLAQEQLSNRARANKLFDRYEYSKSLSLYLPLADKFKTDPFLTERIADCYRLINNYQEAEKWYAKAVSNQKINSISTFYYAEALLNNQKFDAAKVQLKKYFSAAKDIPALNARLSSIDSAMLWMKQPSNYKISNSTGLNSIYSDWGLTYYGNTGLVFVSDKDLGKGIDNRTGDGWLKAYTATSEGKVLGIFPLNLTAKYHVGPIAFNASGDTVYITVNTAAKNLPVEKVREQNLYTRKLELIIATKSDGKWDNFMPFAYNNASRYSVGHAALSANGQVLYFTSDMPGGEGKTDIWYCIRNTDGTWGSPKNCGKNINTAGEEAFATVKDLEGIYFSSKGLPGMGGYDIFYARGEKSMWGKPQNLKYPINSTADDFGLTSRDGLSGYFSSNRAGGMGNDDIYSFSYMPILTKTSISEPFPSTNKFQPQTSYILKNIYYDLDKADIRADAAIELDKLYAILQQNPKIRIELSSHTDSRALDAYNMELSQRRAQAAVDYLVNKGIARNRLIPKGYGETRLLNRCANGVSCPEADHQANRRTEVKIIN